MNRATWMICQAVAIGGLTWMFATPIGYEGEKPIHPAGAFLLSVVIVAFGTAAVVNLWDWAARPFRARRASGLGHADESGDKRMSPSSPSLGRGETSENRGRRRIG